MILREGQRVLRQIFTLRQNISSGPIYELWEADAGDGEGVLIKAWPFMRDEPSPVERNLWDRELRTLYRLASTPEAERRLITLIDAAVDSEARAFVLSLKVPGFARLSDVLATRKNHGWLSDLGNVSKRIALWRGALRLVEGLAQVHRFRSLHRAVRPENVFLDVRRGPDSLRLGGFEWSIRLGEFAHAESRADSPLDRANASLNADWRDLGFLLAGLFGTPGDVLASGDTGKIVGAIEGLQRLSEDERSYLRSLATAAGNGPIERDDVVRTCKELIVSLERPASLRSSDRLGVVVTLANKLGPSDLAIRIAELDPEISATDEDALRRWIENDLSDAEIVSSGEADNRSYFLRGRRGLLPYHLFQFERRLLKGDKESTWNLGYLTPAEFIDERRVGKRTFPSTGMILVYTVQVAHRSYSDISRAVRPWESILPDSPEPAGESLPQIAFLQRFLEVTNEIERAIRETEIYPFRCVRHWEEGTHEYLIVEESSRSVALAMSERAVPMVQYLSDEDEQSLNEVEVYVGPEQELNIEPKRRVEPAEYWTLHEMPPGTRCPLARNQVLLRRFTRADGSTTQLSAPPAQGFLRTRGMFAQVTLIDRRADAIDLLASHLFLQRALVLPDTVYMDTGVEELPLPIPDEANFDQPKREQLRRLWRTRPIYCLQGPPGTGKTTLVAQLLRQIYEDDPSCQVLLTAQAHSAVDHLRDEVSKFVRDRQIDSPNWVAPLAIRLRRPKPNEAEADIEDSASPPAVARQILERSIRIIETRPTLPDYLQDWLTYAREQHECLSDDGDFEQLVRRSANFVYCTSTAADLLELARSSQTFDWSIIEEAGKAHGFDLVLPLQTGHRWLLIGDQNQLPPYREKDFALGLDRLDEICQFHSDLRRFWGDMSPEECRRFTDDAKRWLRFFRELFETAKRRIQSGTPLVGKLTEQHRMHPAIGELISYSFYDSEIANGTENRYGPLDRVVHRFVKPSELAGHAIMWVDVPHASTGYSVEGRRLNRSEVEAIKKLFLVMSPLNEHRETAAVLSPYRRQVKELRDRVQNRPNWALLPQGYAHLDQNRVGVFTVDSFQGRQASVVIVSLVRNNTEREIKQALGFLTEHERINVMVSRAEKLLVLVGAWDFFKAHLSSQSREEGQPFAHQARFIEWLERAFADGRALFVSADRLLEGRAP